jgi:hypothetical protein
MNTGVAVPFDPAELRDPHGRWAKALGNLATASIIGRLDRKRLGQCYKLSAQYIMDHPGSAHTLVHGTIQGGDHPPIDHAWVVLDSGKVWEPASNKEYEPALFSLAFHPVTLRTYTGTEAMTQMVKTGHYGPWDGANATA